MKNKKKKTKLKFLSKLFLLVVLVACSYNILFFDYFSMGNGTKIAVGDQVPLPEGLWQRLGGTVYWQREVPVGLDITNDEKAEVSGEGTNLPQEGTYQVEYSVFNIPLKTVAVEVVNPQKVIVGGHSVGVLLQTSGVTVVGHAPVVGRDGNISYPGKEAGLEIGDFITDINGITIIDDYQVADLIDELGQQKEEVVLTVHRNGEILQLPITPKFCQDTQTYRIGVYIRDNTAGVGTLTFYDPTSKTYGALGHMIADLEEKGEPLGNKGSLVKANVQGLKMGKKGEPGEKIGVFVAGGWEGSIEKNCRLGVFGKADTIFDNALFPEPLAVALPNQITVGPAKIVTVLQGDKLQEFDIEILNIMPNEKRSGKGLVIKVTDEELLEKTGGIIQGMSGSPILQNGMLVGAVTHVFVNDPTRGYGCLADWMLEEAGL